MANVIINTVSPYQLAVESIIAALWLCRVRGVQSTVQPMGASGHGPLAHMGKGLQMFTHSRFDVFGLNKSKMFNMTFAQWLFTKLFEKQQACTSI